MNDKILDELLKLERADDNPAIVSEFESLSEKNREALGERQLRRFEASYARSCAIVGKSEISQDVIKKLSKLELEGETLCLLHLARSKLHRNRNDWEKSLDEAQSALRALGEPAISVELAADAELVIALGLAETGRMFLSMDLLQSVAGKRGVGETRRSIALMYIAVTFWEMGQVGMLRSFPLEKLPPELGHRLEMFIRLCDADIGFFRERVRDGISQVTREDPKMWVTVLIVIAAIVVLGDARDRGTLSESWIAEYCRKMKLAGRDDQRWIAAVCLDMMANRASGGAATQRTPVDLPWRTEANVVLFKALAIGRHTPEAGLRTWKESLDPLFRAHFLNSPLQPQWTDGGFMPDTAWSRALARYFNVSVSPSSLDRNKRILIQGTKLYLNETSSKVSISLSSSPTALLLLKILSTPARREFTMQEIHTQLTRASYSSRLHDARLFKLLSRTRERLISAGFPSPWHMPGDRKIHLEVQIDLVSTHVY